eukprot:11644342-Ditylum_brightwellii.AAC.1
MLNQLAAGTTSTAAALQVLSRDKPPPNLTIPAWTPNNKREWVTLVKSRIANCPFFSVLYDATSDDLTIDLAEANKTED